MVDRKIAPQHEEPAFFPISKATSEVLENGITLHYVDSGNTELLRLEIIFKAGKWYRSKNGQAVLTSKMLLEGTITFSSDDISRTFEKNGAFYEVSCGMDFVNFTVYILNRNLNNLFPIVEEILTVSEFPDKELSTVKNIQIQNLNINLEKNSYLASRHFRKFLFGESHPYGSVTEVSDFNNLTRDDLLSYFNGSLRGNFEVVASGKIYDKDIELLKTFFSRFEKNDSAPASFKVVKNTNESQYFHRDKSLQTSLRIGKLTLHKSDPDYFHLLIFNEVLGGYFGSRLMQKIREEKGYSYGIHSSIIQHVHEAYFVIASDVIKKFREDAIQCIYHEIDQLINHPVPEEELKTVISYFKGSFLSSISSPFALADKFKNLYFNGLGDDFYEFMFDKLDKITPDSLQNFISSNFSSDDFIEVSVG